MSAAAPGHAPTAGHPGLAGRRALVTGASTGIGLAIAWALVAAGACVGLHHRRPATEMTAVLDELRAGGGAVHPLQGDLTDPAVPARLVADFVALAGGLDLLVNNAGGVYGYTDFRDLSEADWNATFALNVTAPMLLTRSAWPHLQATGSGRVVNISTAAVGYAGSARSVHYVAAKAALEATTRTLAKAGAADGILVNAVRCGVIATDMHARIDGYDTARWQERLKLVPLGRAGTPEEVAEMVLFLLGPHGAFVTGQIVGVTGGE